eukprot:scaffold17146_cov50-Attheya_sp.AAC.6
MKAAHVKESEQLRCQQIKLNREFDRMEMKADSLLQTVAERRRAAALVEETAFLQEEIEKQNLCEEFKLLQKNAMNTKMAVKALDTKVRALSTLVCPLTREFDRMEMKADSLLQTEAERRRAAALVEETAFLQEEIEKQNLCEEFKLLQKNAMNTKMAVKALDTKVRALSTLACPLTREFDRLQMKAVSLLQTVAERRRAAALVEETAFFQEEIEKQNLCEEFKLLQKNASL